MTFSLQKSTAMTDTQAANNKSPALNVKGDAAADIASDGESSSPESSFSKLFALFNSDNKTAIDSGAAKTDETAVLGSSDNIDDGIDEDIVAGLIDNTNDVAAIAGDELSTVSQADRSLQSESSDDFLARLGQSSMLLQGNAASDVAPSTEGGPLTEGKKNGNELPSAAKGANIASLASAGMTDLPTTGSSVAGMTDLSTVNSSLAETTDLSTIDSNVAETTDVTPSSNDELTQILQTSEFSTGPTTPTDSVDTLTASTLAGMSTIAGLTDNNGRSAKDDLLATGDVMNRDGSVDSELLDGAGKSGLATGLGEAGMAKNTPFGQANTMAAGISSAAAESNSSALEQLSTTPPEPIEQLDFAQIMESARKPEQLDQTTRILARTPVLTDAEQQVLDKRVHLNNNLASSELNEKIAIMAGKELQTATIRLDPAELGSMNIKLVVQNDQINVTIQAQNNQSRDLLEQQMPRLREMLQQQGITLGDTQVQADSGQQQSGFQQSGQENGQKNSSNEANYAIDSQTEAPVTTPYWQDSAKGVDFYA
ncbi:flagellar hook-length control protein FliK [Moritella sp. Urea-trap-13]|uniref:flagellar hook-length control protein FliK n=1 Tax=Moritella sp. Urea-trap-13 TaxID=2058327 RepID=UPI000C3483E3|nr:flagellar hook-length control protein FliK [Moritella sp. Urea-trap-13]PKH09447.1 flagellar hook-length control protein FliK [Moritella sp. Urea-trap-13]